MIFTKTRCVTSSPLHTQRILYINKSLIHYFTGTYGLPKPLYFPFTKSYWFGQSVSCEYSLWSLLIGRHNEFRVMEEEQQNVVTGSLPLSFSHYLFISFSVSLYISLYLSLSLPPHLSLSHSLSPIQCN